MLTAYTADKVFTGTDWLPDHAVIIQDEIIIDVLPVVSLPEEYVVIKHVPVIAPAFIDVQIYGAAGKLFATYPTVDSLTKLYSHCISGGTNNFLPTVATNTYHVIYKCIDAINEQFIALIQQNK